MMKRSFRILIAFTIAALVMVSFGPRPSMAVGHQGLEALEGIEEFKPGEVIIRFNPEVSTAAVVATMQQYDAKWLHNLADSDIQLYQVPEGEEIALVARLSNDPKVAYAELNYRYQAFETIPNDSYFGYQWGHTQINSTAAWDISTGSDSITIAIIDTGIDETHPDLASKIVAGYDYVDTDTNPHDTNGHGTHVAGIAAALTNNGTGVAGVSWGARIMPIRVLDTEGGGWSTDIIQGILWAYSHGAKVINLSLGGTSYSQAMQDAVNAAYANGSLVVAAMGNCRTGGSGCPSVNPTAYPAALANVMAVAATGPANQISYYSNFGAHCDIAAPGGNILTQYSEGIYSTMPTYAVFLNSLGYYQNYDYLQGTSQASPFVAGLAALVWSLDTTMTPAQVQATIQASSQDLGTPGWDADFGHGLINAQAAANLLNTVNAAPVFPEIDNADGDGDFTVKWEAVDRADTYRVEESATPGFGSMTVVYEGSNLQTAVTAREPGIWYYRVRGANDSGSGPWSKIQSAGVFPAAPKLNDINNLSASDSYSVSWESVPSAIGYVLLQSKTISFTTPMTRYIGSHLMYTVTGQASGTWHYKVHAFNGAGIGIASEIMSTTVATTTMAAPILTTIDNVDGDENYVINWSAITDTLTYTLEQSPNPYFDMPMTIYQGPTATYSITLQAGGTWHYRVRAIGATDSSPWSTQESAIVIVNVYLPMIVKN